MHAHVGIRRPRQASPDLGAFPDVGALTLHHEERARSCDNEPRTRIPAGNKQRELQRRNMSAPSSIRADNYSQK